MIEEHIQNEVKRFSAELEWKLIVEQHLTLYTLTAITGLDAHKKTA